MFVEANGIRIHYQWDGPENGPLVVMSHALAATYQMWDWQIQALTSRYRVLRYDIRGHGKTEIPDGAYTLEMLADDLLGLLDTLGVEKTHLVGLSLGGMIAQHVALKDQNRLSSLVLCDTSSHTPAALAPVWDRRIRLAQTEGMKALLQQTIERWFSLEYEKQARLDIHKISNMIRDTNPDGFVGCCHAVKNLNTTDRLHEIALPTLLIVGEDDPGATVESHEVIRDRIQASRLVVIPNAQHLSNIEQQTTFNQVLTGFLDAHS